MFLFRLFKSNTPRIFSCRDVALIRVLSIELRTFVYLAPNFAFFVYWSFFISWKQKHQKIYFSTPRDASQQQSEAAPETNAGDGEPPEKKLKEDNPEVGFQLTI